MRLDQLGVFPEITRQVRELWRRRPADLRLRHRAQTFQVRAAPFWSQGLSRVFPWSTTIHSSPPRDCFEIGLHHPRHALQSRVFPDLVEAEFLSSVKLSQRLQRDIQTDLVSVLEAVHDRARRRRYQDRNALYASLLDASRPRGYREPYDSKRRIREPGQCSLAVDRKPDVPRQLRPETVNGERGEQTDDTMRSARRNLSQRVELGYFRFRMSVQPASDADELTARNETA